MVNKHNPQQPIAADHSNVCPNVYKWATLFRGTGMLQSQWRTCLCDMIKMKQLKQSSRRLWAGMHSRQHNACSLCRLVCLVLTTRTQPVIKSAIAIQIPILTGFPCAPIFGTGSKARMCGCTAASAAVTSGTSRQIWCTPPAGFLSRNFAIGEAFPSGSNNSSFVLGSSTKATVTPCSGSGVGALTFAPRTPRYRADAAATSGTAIAT